LACQAAVKAQGSDRSKLDTISCADVAYWHKADMNTMLSDAHFRK